MCRWMDLTMIRSTLLACFAFVAVTLSAQETIRLRADEWMPYNGAPGSATPGYAVEIMQAVFGSALDYQTMPWADARKAVLEGEIEAIVGCNKIEAEGLVLPAEGIGRADTALYAKTERTISYSSVLSLKDLKLGAIRDYSYWDALDTYIEKGGPQVVMFDGTDALPEAIQALESGAIDVFPENRYVFIWKLRNLGTPTNRFRTVFTFLGEEIYVAFSPKAPHAKAWAEKLDRSVREMRKDGRLAAILAKYGMRDWKD